MKSYPKFLSALSRACELLPEHPELMSTEDALTALDAIKKLGESRMYYAGLRTYARELNRRIQARSPVHPAEHIAQDHQADQHALDSP